MHEGGNRLGFLLEMLSFLLCEVGMQHLDGRLLVEPHMLAEVDLGVATLAQQADEPVIAKLSSDAVGHAATPAVRRDHDDGMGV